MNDSRQSLAVAENGAMLHSILETISDAIITLDAEGTMLSFNRAAVRIFGYAEGDVLGKSYRLLLPEPAVDADGEVVAGFMDVDPSGVEGAARASLGRRHDGEVFPMEFCVAALPLSGQQLSTVIVSDISACRAQEKALAEISALHAVILDTVQDAILMTDIKGVIISLNTATERIFGYGARFLTGRDIRMLLPESRQAKFAVSALNNMINLGREVEGRRKSGQIFPMEVDVVEAKLDGKLVYTCLVRDMTKRQEAEREMLLFRSLVEYTSDPVYVLNPSKNYQMVYTNVAGLKHFGYAADQLYAMHESDWDVNYDQEKMDALWQRLQAGESALFEAEHKDAAGDVVPVEISCNYLRHGDEEYWAGHFRDITERRRMDRMKSEFISTVSHELRTPLTSILVSLGLVAGDLAESLPVQTRRFIEIARQNSERLSLLINDILDVEKIEAGCMQFNLEPLNLRHLLEQAIEENYGYGAQYEVQFKLDWQAPDGTTVLVDSGRFMQVMANLLSNAAKFSPSGGVVEVGAKLLANDAVSIGVTDHGEGIPLEFRAHLFQKFSQADASTTRSKGGTGLGLSIAKAIVEKFGGEMGFDTEIGLGTTMSFRLPLTPPVASRQP